MAACNEPAIRVLVDSFGRSLQQVSLTRADAAPQIRQRYGPYVTPALLETWVADPRHAPGRQVSSPWPDRIDVITIAPGDSGECRVEATVVYMTSVELARGGAASREPVTLRVREDGGWRIAGFESRAPASTDSTSADAALDVVRRYYAAIAARDFHSAYALWGEAGKASGQTFAEFAAGFRETARVSLALGEPGRIEPAAGSRYVEVPVTVHAVTTSGVEQHFAGTYTLRRSVVDGATPEQRRWRLHSASIARVR